MKPTLLVFLMASAVMWSCSPQDAPPTPSETEHAGESGSAEHVAEAPARIPVLNFATFHMGFTNDATSVEFDQHDKANQESAKEIGRMLAAFKPTVILIETRPEIDTLIQREYREYLANPDTIWPHPSEVELIAYELGRVAGTERIYGIDHKMGYNYMIGEQIENSIDSVMHNTYYNNVEAYYPDLNLNEDELDLLEKLKLNNSDRYLDFMITVNADMLTHAGTDGNFEGADEAARYYQRNLRMYSNMNRLDLTPDDRVFVLMGSSHTAYFRDFISRSPKYVMVDTFEYLK